VRLAEIVEKGNRSGGAQCAGNRLPGLRTPPKRAESSRSILYHEILIDFKMKS